MKFREKLILLYWFVFQDGIEITQERIKLVEDRLFPLFILQKETESKVIAIDILRIEIDNTYDQLQMYVEEVTITTKLVSKVQDLGEIVYELKKKVDDNHMSLYKSDIVIRGRLNDLEEQLKKKRSKVEEV